MALRIVLIVIGVLVIALLVFLAALGASFGCWPFPARTVSPTLPATLTFTTATTAAPTSGLPPSGLPVLTSAPTAAGATPTASAEGVNFEASFSDLTGSMFDYTAKARLTNTGTADAHNVQARVELLFGQDQHLRMNGQDYLLEDIGTLAAGQSFERQEKIALDSGDAISAWLSGGKVTVRITVTSTERTQVITYDYHF